MGPEQCRVHGEAPRRPGKAEGNILIVRLSLGATAGKLIYDEYQKMLARNPGLKVVGEVEGQATRSVAQRNVAQIVPACRRSTAWLQSFKEFPAPARRPRPSASTRSWTS